LPRLQPGRWCSASFGLRYNSQQVFNPIFAGADLGEGEAPSPPSRSSASRCTVKDWFSGIRCLAVHACRFVCGHHWSCVALLISFGAGFGAVGFGYAQATAPNTVASGTKLYLRLETAVSTESSHLNQAVSAHAVREVTSSQGVLVPLGAEVTGSIEFLRLTRPIMRAC